MPLNVSIISKVGHTCWPIWPTEQSGYDLCTCCNMTKIFDMEQCHRFLGGHRIGPLPRLKILWTPDALKQLEIISWFHTMIFQYIHQTQNKVYSLVNTCFSKEHVISGSHPDNLVCRCMRPTWLTKRWTKWPRVIQPTFNP